MGRRNGIPRTKSVDLSAFDPEVQKKVNDLSHIFLDEAKKRMEEKIKAGEFNDLGFKDFMKEIRGMLRAIARPATSMQQINLPGASQQPAQIEGEKPPRVIEADKEMNPGKVARLRKAQQRHLERDDGPPKK